MDLGDTNIYAPNIIDRYKKFSDNLDNMCWADVAATYIYEKADMNYKPDGEKAS